MSAINLCARNYDILSLLRLRMKLFGGTYPSIFKTQSVVLYILISPHLLYSGSFQTHCWQIFSIFGEKAPKNTNHLKVKNINENIFTENKWSIVYREGYEDKIHCNCSEIWSNTCLMLISISKSLIWKSL